MMYTFETFAVIVVLIVALAVAVFLGATLLVLVGAAVKTLSSSLKAVALKTFQVHHPPAHHASHAVTR